MQRFQNDLVSIFAYYKHFHIWTDSCVFTYLLRVIINLFVYLLCDLWFAFVLRWNEFWLSNWYSKSDVVRDHLVICDINCFSEDVTDSIHQKIADKFLKSRKSRAAFHVKKYARMRVLSKVNNKSIKIMFEICSKLTIKIPEQR